MKTACTNIVMCFEQPTTNAGALLELVDSDSQPTWQGSPRDLVAGYRFLAERWRPGDRIFVFGAGHGAYCAHALTRLLDTVGVRGSDDELLEYALASWALPRTRRTTEDWQRLDALAAELRGGPPVPVRFLGLWDAVKPAGLQPLSSPSNVVDGRHALAIDGRHAPQHLASEHVDEVWFRGTHTDVTGSSAAHPGLSRITLDWVLDGARRAGLSVHGELPGAAAPAPTVYDALTTSRTPAMGLLAGVRLPSRARSLPDGAQVHASVDVYLRDHDSYWNRLPSCVVWADTDWSQRGERLLVRGAAAPRTNSAPAPRFTLERAS